MKVYVHGFFGAPNVGDEAICKAIVEGLRRAAKDVDVTMVTDKLPVSRDFTGIDARLLEGFYPSMQYWRRFLHHVYRIARSDLLIIGGGGLLQDVHSWSTVCRYMLSGCLGVLLNCPVVMLGIGAGPISRPWIRRLTGAVCSLMTAIYVRNPVNKDVLVRCGVKPERIEVAADLVPSLSLNHWAGPDRHRQVPPRRIGFALREWPGLNEDGVVRLWENLAGQGCKIDLLCYEHEHDRTFYESLLARCSEACRQQITIRAPKKLQDAIADITAVDFVVAMRLHACIFAGYLSVPLLGLPYHPKVSVFMEKAGMAGQIRSITEVGEHWAADIHEVATEYANMPRGLSPGLRHRRERSLQSFAEAMAIARSNPAGKGGASHEAKIRALPILILLVFMGLGAEGWHVVDYLRRKIVARLPRS